jgi:hypothetical protein
MGVLTTGASNVTIQNTWAHHVGHACFYVSNSNTYLLKNSRASWCGLSWDSSGTLDGIPVGFYAFSESGTKAQNITVDGLECDKVSSACVNTRNDDSDANNAIKNFNVKRIRVVDDGTGDAAGRSPGCATFRGVDGLVVDDVFCERTTGGLDFPNSAYPATLEPGPYRTDGSTCLDGTNAGNACDEDEDCPGATTCSGGANGCCAWDVDGGGTNLQSSNVALSRIVIQSQTSGPGFTLGAYIDGISLEKSAVRDQANATGDHCITGSGPYRNLVIDDFYGRNCGADGITLGGGSEQSDWGSADPREAVRLTRIAIDGADGDLTNATRHRGITLNQGCVGCTFSDWSLRGNSEDGLFVVADLFQRNTLSRLRIDYLPDVLVSDYYIGIMPLASLPTCDAALDGTMAWISDAATASDCVTGAGTILNICVCNDDGTPAWDDGDTIGGASQTDSFCIDLTDLAAGVDDNVFTDITCISGGRNQRHQIELPNDAGSTGNSFQRILCGDSRRGAIQGEQAAGCIDFHASTGTWSDVECYSMFNNGTNNRRCVCEDASCTTGSAF